MSVIPKHHIYQMWSSDGAYIGVLQGVTTPFALSQDINTIGPGVLTIGVAQNSDTPLIGVKAITTEDGKWITTEDGKGLTTEGELPNYAVDNSKIKNGNRIKVTEVSDYHPTGLVVFDGVVRKWNINYGTNSDGQLYAVSSSADMNGHMVKSSELLVVSNTTIDSTFPIYGDTNGQRYAYLYDFFAVNGITNMSSVVARLAALSGVTPATVTLNIHRIGLISQIGPSFDIFAAIDNPASIIATQDLIVSSTSQADYKFTFPIPANMPAGYYYAITVTSTGTSGTGVNLYYNYASVAAGAQYTNPNDGHGWRFGTNPSDPGNFYGLNGDMYFKFYSIPPYTKATITNFEPSALLRQTIANYNSEGGVVTATDLSVETTGVTIPEYTFSSNIVAEGLDILLGLSPEGFYYTIDPGSGELTFKHINDDEPDYKLLFRRDISTLDLSASVENVVNDVYFTGGKVSTTNIYVRQQDLDSQRKFNTMIGRISDPRVMDEDTANALATNHLNKNSSEVYETSVVIPDNVTDITKFKPGQTIGFGGFATFVDTLILPIMRVERSYDSVLLMLGSLPKRQASIINNTQTQVASLTTVDNPNQPS
jgi:hypothetical protein